MVGQPAPDFTAVAYMPSTGEFKTVNLSDYKDKKNVLLYFYTLDWTFVCASEILAFDRRLKEFSDRNVEVLAISTDSTFCHRAWVTAPAALGGLDGMVNHPMISDLDKSISKRYMVLRHIPEVASRATFFIDTKGVVRFLQTNSVQVGRSVTETLRLIDAVLHHQNTGEVTPADWVPGTEGIAPTQEGLVKYLESLKVADESTADTESKKDEDGPGENLKSLARRLTTGAGGGQ